MAKKFPILLCLYFQLHNRYIPATRFPSAIQIYSAPNHKIYCDKMCINTVLPSTVDIIYEIFTTTLQYTILVLQVSVFHVMPSLTFLAQDY